VGDVTKNNTFGNYNFVCFKSELIDLKQWFKSWLKWRYKN